MTGPGTVPAATVLVTLTREDARRIVAGVLRKVQDRSLDLHERGAWLALGGQLVLGISEVE